MKMSEYKQIKKKEMGWRWYWLHFQLLFDFSYQYDTWLIRKDLQLIKALKKHREKIKKYYRD